MKLIKIEKGWYYQPEHDLHIVKACNFNNPAPRPLRWYALDWVAVTGCKKAEAIHPSRHNPGKRITLSDVIEVHNTKRELLGHLQRQLDAGRVLSEDSQSTDELLAEAQSYRAFTMSLGYEYADDAVYE